SIVLMLFSSRELHFKAGVADRVSEDSPANIKKAVETAKSSLGKAPALCIITPNGWNINCDLLIEGLKQALGESFPIFGGTAGDQWRGTGTYQFYNSNVFTDAVPFLLIAGPLLFSFGVESGWMPIEEKGKVTQAEKNVVFKISNQSALDYYKNYLGEDIDIGTDVVPGDYPLAVFEEDGKNFYLRALQSFNKEKGSITFTGNVPEGATVQITHANRDKIIEGAKNSVNSA
ncbi:unnamed protein product, partial [marine sediment metagenome]